jgi:hypothetical protein
MLSPEGRISNAITDMLVISEIMVTLEEATAPDGTLSSTWMGFLGRCLSDVADRMSVIPTQKWVAIRHTP